MYIACRKKLSKLLVVLMIVGQVAGYGYTANAFTLNSYRWRSDDYAESSSTWSVAENTKYNNVRKNDQARVRLAVSKNALSGQSGLYNPELITYSASDMTGATSVTLSDDASTSAIALPFTFNFYGVNYNSLYIGSNGYINFLAQVNNISQTLPSTGTPNATIAGLQRDLDPRYGGTISYKSFGSAPNRYFVVSYVNVPFYSTHSNTVTFQIKIFETSNIAEVHTLSASNGNYTQGVENETGTSADWYDGRNASTFSLSNDGIRFTPTGGSTFGNLLARLEYGVKSTSCSAISSWVQIPATASSGEHWQMATSGYLTDGQSTTHNTGISTPSGKSFIAGKANTATSQSDMINLATTQFTEFEYSIEPTDDSIDGQEYCFRITNNGTELANYNQYAELQIVAKPLVVNDSYTVAKNNTYAVSASGVLANDTEYNGDSLTAIKLTDPTNGAVTLNSDGSFSYTPDPDYVGADSFTYKANNGVSDSSNIATVSLTVGNQVPATSSDNYTVAKDTVLTVGVSNGVLANDSDNNNDTMTAVKATDPTNGSVILNADGSFVYTPDSNYAGPDSFTYYSTDGTEPPPTYIAETVNINITSSTSTTENKIIMERIEAGRTGSLDMSFNLTTRITGTLTVTFPVGFTINSAFTSGTCAVSGTIGAFGFDPINRTLTAEKNNCTGAINLYGAGVTNPSSPGEYIITWINDDPGSTTVYITDSDNVSVSGKVDPYLTFDLDTSISDVETSAPYSVGLGTLTTLAVNSSNGTTINSIWVDLATNATLGAVTTVKSTGGLISSSVSTDTISSSTATLSAGTAGYGICVRTATQIDGASFGAIGNYSGSCGYSVGHAVGVLSTSPQVVLAVGGPMIGGRAEILVKSSISPVIPAHSDYVDTLTIVATPTY